MENNGLKLNMSALELAQKVAEVLRGLKVSSQEYMKNPERYNELAISIIQQQSKKDSNVPKNRRRRNRR